MVTPDQADLIYRIGSLVTYVYLAAVVALIVRLEILRKRGGLPNDMGTVFSPIRRPMDTWAIVLGQKSRIRWGRLFRMLLTNQHTQIGDSWTTILVYVSRVLLVASLGLFALDIVTGS